MDGQKALAETTRRRTRSPVEVQLSPFAIHRTRRNTRVRRRRRTYRILLDGVLALTQDHLHEVQGQVLYGLEESALWCCTMKSCVVAVSADHMDNRATAASTALGVVRRQLSISA